MTQDRIIQGNMLIAEFMGGEYTEAKSNDIVFARLKEWKLVGVEHSVRYCDSVDLKYHHSWDWLMPVVDKIMLMQGNPNEMFMGATLERGVMFDSVTNLPITYPRGMVIDKIVAFIKWYNEQVKNKTK